MPNYGKPFAGICVAIAVLICGVTGYPVAPEILPDKTGTLELGSTATAVAGSTFLVVGEGFAAGAAVTVSVYSQPQLLAEVVADGAGSISATVSLPADLEPGSHTVAALGVSPGGEVWSLQSALTVVQTTELPFTGYSFIGWALAGLLLVVGGFVLIRSTVFGRALLPE